ncbi:TetR/AcrR family transcriptional regulator [Cryobacterium sp. W22_MBD10_FK3]|uniref:TetR/AcrR family transcriptional regulator n=1 Tax=Cryobacterium sp. W22_MBD10_FK3 TaxID=3240273 RepID=UPI003F903A9A
MVGREVDESTFVRERLIRGATRLIEEEGCSSLGVRRLAQASDRTTMCVYSKFGSRGGLLTTVYERVGADLLSALRNSDEPPPAYLDWAREHPQLYTMLFDQPLDALDIATSARKKLITDLVDVFDGDLRSGVEEWSWLHGALAYERIVGDRPAIDARLSTDQA